MGWSHEIVVFSLVFSFEAKGTDFTSLRRKITNLMETCMLEKKRLVVWVDSPHSRTHPQALHGVTMSRVQDKTLRRKDCNNPTKLGIKDGTGDDHIDDRAAAVQWDELFERCDYINSEAVRSEMGVSISQSSFDKSA